MGIAIAGEAQILLIDTPGIFEPKRRLDRAMVAAAWGSAQDADLICSWSMPRPGSRARRRDARRRRNGREPAMLILNKVDLVRRRRC